MKDFYELFKQALESSQVRIVIAILVICAIIIRVCQGVLKDVLATLSDIQRVEIVGALLFVLVAIAIILLLFYRNNKS